MKLSEPEQTDTCTLIRSYLAIFSDKPTQTTFLVHYVDVGSAHLTAIKQHAYCVNPVKHAIMKQDAEYLLENVLAVPSSSPWSLPSLLVSKPYQTYRLCTVYRKVNAITKPESYPLPRMDDCVDRVGPVKFVTKLDLLSSPTTSYSTQSCLLV